MIKTSNGNAIQNPLIGTADKADSDMVRYAAEFGMTPSARVPLAVDGSGAAGSKWEGLTGGVEAGQEPPARQPDRRVHPTADRSQRCRRWQSAPAGGTTVVMSQ